MSISNLLNCGNYDFAGDCHAIAAEKRFLSLLVKAGRRWQAPHVKFKMRELGYFAGGSVDGF
jgi:hypothetical protein